MLPLTLTCPSEPDPRWDAFVAEHEDPHFEQTAAWADAQGVRGWSCVRLLAARGDALVGGAQILERRSRFGRVAYLNRGPLLAGDDPEAAAAVADELKRLCIRRRHRYLAVVPPYRGGTAADALARRGFVVRPPGFPPHSAMKATCVLDLQASEASLLAGMHETTRKRVRKAARLGVQVDLGTGADVAVFEQLVVELCRRRGVTPNVQTGPFVARVWQEFSATGRAALFLARAGGRPVAAAFVIALGGWLRRWRRGWSGEHADLYPNNALDWAIIRWAKAQGLRWFDSGGIDTRLAERLVRGEPVPRDEDCGMSRYKLGFGGRILLPPADRCYSANLLVRLALRQGKVLLAFPTRLLRRLGPVAIE